MASGQRFFLLDEVLNFRPAFENVELRVIGAALLLEGLRRLGELHHLEGPAFACDSDRDLVLVGADDLGDTTEILSDENGFGDAVLGLVDGRRLFGADKAQIGFE